MVMRPSIRNSQRQPEMPPTPSISMRAALSGAPMTCESAVHVATRASAGPVSLELKNSVMWYHRPAQVQHQPKGTSGMVKT